ncbi:hypothetical protein WR25_18974 [Diploscapter pachys]|uniref:Saposin B-type domain-containing protein n=1 Tax=Diploscapter pachys TaxID=2018661 RepID=A0A2A2LZY8_9BILA|nr:hypothetical protein WR25_18974 [Diploscapter pachys]
MFCEMITESIGEHSTPTSAISHMFKKCDRMGLMEPVCMQFVNENLKEVFRHMRNGVEPDAICATHTGGIVTDEVGAINDDYSSFADEPIKNKAVNNDLKLVTYAPHPIIYEVPKSKMGIPGKNFPVATLPPVLKQEFSPNKPIPISQLNLRRGYYWYHYPWSLLPRQYLLRPAMQYTYPLNMQNVVYRYPVLPWRDHYNIYRTHPGIGTNACGPNGCGYSQGCGSNCNGGCQGNGCSNDYHNEGGTEEEDDDKIYVKDKDKEINKQDPLEDIDLEDLEKLDQADEETTSSPFSTDKTSSGSDSDKDLLEPDSKSKPLQEEPNLGNLEELEPISESDNKKI